MTVYENRPWHLSPVCEEMNKNNNNKQKNNNIDDDVTVRVDTVKGNT